MAVDDDGNTKSRPRIFMGEIYVLSMINDCDAKYGLYWWFAMSRSTQWIVRTAPCRFHRHKPNQDNAGETAVMYAWEKGVGKSELQIIAITVSLTLERLRRYSHHAA
jgi:hypothetical protein